MRTGAKQRRRAIGAADLFGLGGFIALAGGLALVSVSTALVVCGGILLAVAIASGAAESGLLRRKGEGR